MAEAVLNPPAKRPESQDSAYSSGSGLPSGAGDRLALIVDALVKEFGGRRVLDQVSFTAKSGELIAVTGPSGCGKTTLLNCLGALDRPTSGLIELRPATAADATATPVQPAPIGLPTAAEPGTVADPGIAPDKRRINVGHLRATRRRLYHRDVVGFVFQNAGLVDQWRVWQNLRVPLTPAGRPPSRTAIRQTLKRVGAAGLERARVYTLSGGEQQRVALARLLLKDPPLVLADEPMAALDQTNAEFVFGVLRGLSRRGALVLMCTHDPAVVQRCDRVIELPGREIPSDSPVDTGPEIPGREDTGPT
ncbi:MAG: ATP-binding cassette domain-containing protein [Bifidobacteriaceae bacterium]|jgi:putative ABC transport system ATP-binding protein|nr:ATP-binding cassette domain-containing protein [Bifidobacteriaceae bacterium]